MTKYYRQQTLKWHSTLWTELFPQNYHSEKSNCDWLRINSILSCRMTCPRQAQKVKCLLIFEHQMCVCSVFMDRTSSDVGWCWAAHDSVHRCWSCCRHMCSTRVGKLQLNSGSTTAQTDTGSCRRKWIVVFKLWWTHQASSLSGLLLVPPNPITSCRPFQSLVPSSGQICPETQLRKSHFFSHG